MLTPRPILNCNPRTFNTLVEYTQQLIDELGPDESERAYQRAMQHLLELAGYAVSCEELVPSRFRGRCIGFGKADIVVGRCVIEMKTTASCASTHGEQVRRYIRCKNQELAGGGGGGGGAYRNDMTGGCPSPYFGAASEATDGKYYWGIIINIVKKRQQVEYFVPGRMDRAVAVQYDPFRTRLAVVARSLPVAAPVIPLVSSTVSVGQAGKKRAAGAVVASMTSQGQAGKKRARTGDGVPSMTSERHAGKTMAAEADTSVRTMTIRSSERLAGLRPKRAGAGTRKAAPVYR